MTATIHARAPGRVNLIGEHTDYNDGFVMPVAIVLATEVFARARDDRRVTVRSNGFDETIVFDARDVSQTRRHDWGDYVRGVLLELERAGIGVSGADLDVTSTVPVGAGLSSSASFEVAVALALLQLAPASMERSAIARLAQRAEAEGAGVRSGIMDQFAVLFAIAGQALLLDTRSLAFENLPLPPRTAIVVCNTMAPRSLATGAYNARRSECEAAVAILRKRNGEVNALRDVTMGDLEAARGELGPVLYRRAKHVVSENARVLEAARALEHGDAAAFGRLMDASHESLRDDYEVSSPELDAIVTAARAFDGAYGARMTGAGFGGCTVNLVAADSVVAFCREVAERYRAATGIEPEFYDGTPSAGASVDA